MEEEDGFDDGGDDTDSDIFTEEDVGEDEEDADDGG